MVRVLLLTAILQATQSPGFVTGVVRGSNGQPAAGVRVYAMAANQAAPSIAAPGALESQTQTDSNGRYRLEVGAGRYYIGSGAVDAPTFFPGTRDVMAARVVSVTAGALIADIDFSSFVPARRIGGGLPPPPGSAGTLSGTIRDPDGKPTPNMVVVAFSTSMFTPIGTPGLTGPAAAVATALQQSIVQRLSGRAPRAVTGINGAFVIQNIPPDTYYIVAGFDDAPVFYPGVANVASAKSIPTTPTSNLSGLDFIIPGDSAGVRVSGRVTTAGGDPAIGASVTMTKQPLTTGLPAGLLTARPKTTAAQPDGSFELVKVSAGTYKIETQLSGVRPRSQTLIVSDQPIRDLNLTLPAALLSGRILMEDGSPVPGVQAFNEALITTVGPAHPGMIQSILFPISRDGTFSRVIEADEYRVTLRYLPQEYTVRSITAGSVDLLKDHLIATADSVKIDIRIANASPTSAAGGVRFSGVIKDSGSGMPSTADRITLCCVGSGPAEGFSTKVRPDGSFEFSSIPPGEYLAELKFKGDPTTAVTDIPIVPSAFLTEPRINIANDGAIGVELRSTPTFVQVSAIVVDSGGTPPPNMEMRIAFRARSSQATLNSVATGSGLYTTSLPRGDEYTVLVLPPPGYMVRSIGGQPASVPFEIRSVQSSIPTITIVVERTR